MHVSVYSHLNLVISEHFTRRVAFHIEVFYSYTFLLSILLIGS